MPNTITHQQIIDHGQRLIQTQVASAHERAQRYRAGQITWRCAHNLISDSTTAIQRINSTLASIAPDGWISGLSIPLNKLSDTALAELDAAVGSNYPISKALEVPAKVGCISAAQAPPGAVKRAARFMRGLLPL